MAYFDLSSLDAVDRKTASLLGYKKIFTRSEIPVADKLDSSQPCIVRSGEAGMLSRALRRSNVLGVIIKDNELLRMIVEEAVVNEKVICLSVHDLTCVDTRSRQRNLYRMRGLMAFAMRSKARIALVTAAEVESCLLSSMQMMEIAKYLGAKEEQAKKILGSLGEIP